MASFLQFLLAQDRLGHHFSLSYKGRESHNTLLGAALSIVIKALVVVILTQKTIALVQMTDPDVQVSTRAIFSEEVDEAGKVNFSDYGVNIGFAVRRTEIVEGESPKHWHEDVSDWGNVTASEHLLSEKVYGPDEALVSCDGLFSDVEDMDDQERDMTEGLRCLNPETTFISGTRSFKNNNMAWFEVDLNLNFTQNSSTKVIMFHSHKIFDFKDPV